MIEIIVLFTLGLLGAIALIIWFNSDWIAPGGWISWFKCRFRRDD